MSAAERSTGSLPSAFMQSVVKLFLRTVVLGYILLLRLARVLRKRRPPLPGKIDVLLTGTYQSENWVRAHVTPLAESSRVASVRFVTGRAFPAIEGVHVTYAPRWLQSLSGEIPARLLVFAWLALRHRPHVIGGFHLLLNGMTSVVLARLLARRSLYLCVGRGRSELLMEGRTENRLFGLLRTRDPWISRRLVEIAKSADLIVPMGSSSEKVFREEGVTSPIHVISGSVDETAYTPSGAAKDFDIVFVGRLVPVKRLDLLLQASAVLKRQRGSLTVAIVGDGPMRSQAERIAASLGLKDEVFFAGSQADTAVWYKRGRVFVLTSDSEGLSLALMEAMMCGLPAVVPNVGDLGDLVRDGQNGFLVNERMPEAFAAAMMKVLVDEATWNAFAANAAQAAKRFARSNVAAQWDRALSAL